VNTSIGIPPWLLRASRNAYQDGIATQGLRECYGGMRKAPKTLHPNPATASTLANRGANKKRTSPSMRQGPWTAIEIAVTEPILAPARSIVEHKELGTIRRATKSEAGDQYRQAARRTLVRYRR
jgi:hypothetical protein